MQKEGSHTTYTEDRSLPDMWWVEGAYPDLTWHYRVKHWTKSQRANWRGNSFSCAAIS